MMILQVIVMDKIAIYHSDDGEIKISARVESDTIDLLRNES